MVVDKDGYAMHFLREPVLSWKKGAPVCSDVKKIKKIIYHD